MNANPSLIDSLSPTGDPTIDLRVRLGEVDASMRVPAMLFLVSAVMWLLAGTAFAMIAAIKATNPDFLGATEWLTFGRVRTAHLNAMNAAAGSLPWKLSFSYSRALQEPALKTWNGDAANGAAAQAALYHRAQLNSAASLGRYEESMEKAA